MKKVLKIAIYIYCRVLSFLYSYSTAIKIRKYKTIIHSIWISSEFKKFGKNLSIGTNFVLKGGKYITIGNSVGIGNRGILTAWDSYMGDTFSPEIIIGNMLNEMGRDQSINRNRREFFPPSEFRYFENSISRIVTGLIHHRFMAYLDV